MPEPEISDSNPSLFPEDLPLEVDEREDLLLESRSVDAEGVDGNLDAVRDCSTLLNIITSIDTSEDLESSSDTDSTSDAKDSDSFVQQYCGGNTDPDDIHSSGSDSDSEEVVLDKDKQGTPSSSDLLTSATLQSLRSKLLGDYVCPPGPPEDHHMPRALSESERLSLLHYSAWRASNGTHLAYAEHQKVLQHATGIEIMSLFCVRKLASSLTGLYPKKIDMCPKSCIAYTGDYSNLNQCPHISPSGVLCGEPRYKASSKKRVPRAQVTILPVMETIQALFANADTSWQIRHRDSCLRAALNVVGQATQKYSDFGNSAVHKYHAQHLKLFQDPRDIALALSTDGAQLTMKKQSNTWLLILIVLNLPAEIRYKSGNVIINLATPGPNSPGDIESFLYPLFQEMAGASEGIWMWDAVDSSYFCHRAHIVMGLGDMLGSAKISGMAGHTANKGDRFSTVEAAKSSLKKGSRSLYYPMVPPQSKKYNPTRPISYDLANLPMRTELQYWSVINRLELSTSKQEKARITKESGISRLPLCAASLAFVHPTFFPLDPFHLFYENCMAHIWDTWTVYSDASERVHMSATKAVLFGQIIVRAMKTLPPSFCGPIRDPHLKRQSQFKVYEWMALLHWYILPIGMELGLDPSVLMNFAHFVHAVEFSMTVQARSEEDIASLHATIRKFLTGFEAIYVGNDPEKVSRFRLCIFQLIHVPMHIKWNGSIRIGSQATVERTIGEVGHRIRSRKSPFANLANIITEKELVRVLKLYYPSLSISNATGTNSEQTQTQATPLQRLKIKKSEAVSIVSHTSLIEAHIQSKLADSNLYLERWGKLRLPNKRVLRTLLSDKNSSASRFYRWFEARGMDSKFIFGEALAIYTIKSGDIVNSTVIIYKGLINIEQPLGVLRGKWDQTLIHVLDVSLLIDVVGIWESEEENKNVYILRKHPAFGMLSAEELGKAEEEANVGEEQEEEV